MKTRTPRRILVALACLIAIPLTHCNPDRKAAKTLASAQSYLQQGNDVAAAIELKKLLQTKPGHPQALKELGMIRLRQGAWHESARLLSAARLKLPDDGMVTLTLSRSLFEMGFLGDCRHTLNDLLDRSPGHADALPLLAQCAMSPPEHDDCARRCRSPQAATDPAAALALAILDLRRGDLSAAQAAIDRIVTTRPDDPTALRWKADITWLQKHPADALALMKRASDLAGPRSRETDAYAALLVQTHHQMEAVTLLNHVTKVAPDYLPPLRLLAQIALAEGKYDQAARHISVVLAASPLDLEAGLLQSQIDLQLNRPERAAEHLRTLDQTYPGRPFVQILRAKACLATKETPIAAEILDQLLAGGTLIPEAIIMRAQIHLDGNQPTEAVRLLEPLQSAQPDLAVARQLLLRAYLKVPRPQDALNLLAEEAAKRPQDPQPLLQSARLLRIQHKLDESRTLLEKALALAPGNPEAVGLLAAIDLEQNQPAEALERSTEYFAKHPDSAEASLLHASVCYALKDFENAERLARRTLELNPATTSAFAILARIQSAQGRSEEAVRTLEALLVSEPDNIPARMHLGCLFQELNRIDDAYSAFQKIVEISPDFAAAYNNLAVIESDHRHQLPQALAHASKARSLAPQDPAITDTLGWIEWQQGHYRQALSLLLEAATGLPSAPTIQYHLAMARSSMGQTAEAIKTLETALESPTPFPEKQAAANYLKLLKDLPTLDLPALESHLGQNPADISLLMEKAARQATHGAIQDALQSLDRALQSNPDLDAAHLAVAELYLSEFKQPDKALAAASQARKLNPGNPHAAALLARIHLTQGNHEQAYALSSEAIRELKEDDKVRFHHAWSAYLVGRIKEAQKIMGSLNNAASPWADDAKRFLTLTDPAAPLRPDTPALVATELTRDPHSVPALMTQAALDPTHGSKPAECYRAIIRIAPSFDPARLALARLLVDDPEHLDEVETLATEARKRIPDDAELQALLGVIAFRRGKFDYAAQLLTEVASQRPLTARELFALGISQASTGAAEDAKSHLNQALHADLPPQEAAAARKTLQDLGAFHP